MADHERVLESKRRKLTMLDEANGETFATIRTAAPDFMMDSLPVRLDMLFTLLKDKFGDEEMWLDFEIEFHEKVKEALEPVLTQVQEHQRRAKLSVVKKAPVKLLGPDGRPIV